MSAIKRHRADILLGLALLLVAPVAFFPELVFAGRALTHMDLTWIQYPLRIFAARSWLAGAWPLWNPYVLCGFPVLAEGLVGVLHPFNALFTLPIPAYVALNAFVLVHLGLAALSTFILARSLGLGRAAATLAGLSYGFGGAITAQITNECTLNGLAWMPLVLCLVMRAAGPRSSRGLGWAAGGGVAFALLILDAQPQTAFYTGLVVLGCGAWLAATRAWRREPLSDALQPLLAVAVTGVVGLGLAALQWLPTVELWRQSVRAQGVGYAQVIFQSEHPVQLLEMLVPNVFGNPVVSYRGLDSFEELYAYAGLLPLVLAVLAWRRRADPRLAFFWALLPIALLLALGGYTPFYRLLEHIPGFSVFRVPARWMAVVSLALAILAAGGLDELLHAPDRGRAVRPLLRLLGLAAGLTLAAAVLVSFYRTEALAWVAAHIAAAETRDLLTTALKRFLLLHEAKAENWLPTALPWITIPGATLLAVAAAGSGLLWAFARGRLRPAGTGALLVGLTLADLLTAGGGSVTELQPASYWQFDAQVIDRVRSEAGWSRAYGLDATTAEQRKAHPEWREPARRAIAWIQQHTPTAFQVFSPLGNWTALGLERYVRLSAALSSERTADVMSVRLLFTWGALSGEAASQFRELGPYPGLDPMVHLYENPDALPRAYWSGHIEAATDGSAALARLADPAFDPHAATLIEGQGLPSSGREGTPLALAPAAIREYTPARVRIDVEAPADGWLVLTDTAYPGWRASVDGRDAPIRPANYLFRGVPVTAGRHVVEFVYWPASFYVGLAISAATVLLLAGIALLRRRRRPTHASSNQPY